MLSSIPSKRNLEPDVEARESMRGGRADKSNDFQGTTSPNILCGRRVDTWVHGFGGTVERVLDTQRCSSISHSGRHELACWGWTDGRMRR